MNPKQSRFTALVAALRLPAEANLLQPLDLDAVSAVSQLDWEELCPFIGLQMASGNDTSKWRSKMNISFPSDPAEKGEGGNTRGMVLTFLLGSIES